MKKFKYIVWSILIFLSVFYLIPVGLLRVPSVQKFISHKASEVFKEKLGTEVKIGNINFELFNKLIIKDVYLEDQSKDTLFYAKRLAVGFEFLPLLKGKIRFSSAQLFSFQLHLNKENDQAPLNLQFVLDAFAKKDTTNKKSPIDLRIQNLNIGRGVFSYRIKDAAPTSEKFNPKDILLKDISAKIHIEKLTTYNLEAGISRLACSEQSGFAVSRVAFDLFANKQSAGINHLELKLPNSLVQLANISVDYKKRPDSSFLASLQIIKSAVSLQDIKFFVPALAGIQDRFYIEGKLSGNTDHILLTDFHLHNDRDISLYANSELNHPGDPENCFIRGNIETLHVSVKSLKQWITNFSKTPPSFPKPLDQLGYIHFEGDVKGLISDLTAHGIFKTDVGNIITDIRLKNEESLHIIGKASSQGINLKKLLANNNFGNASFDMQLDAKQNRLKQFSGKVDANIGRFEFKNYSYENLNFKGEFSPSSFQGDFLADSPDGKVTATGLFHFDKENSQFNFSAKADQVKLDRLNLSKKYKNSSLSLEISANFSGNNIDNMLGDIRLKNLKFGTEKGGYYLDSLYIETKNVGNEKMIDIRSDIVHGEIKGIYSFLGIAQSLNQMAAQYLPSLVSLHNGKKAGSENIFSVNLTIEDTQNLSDVLDLPFALYQKTRIIGQYNSLYNKIRMELYSPKITFGSSIVESGMVLLDNSGKEAHLDITGTTYVKDNKKQIFSVSTSAFNDQVNTNINWDNEEGREYKGNLSWLTSFSKNESNHLVTSIDVRKSDIIFNDSNWVVHPAHVVFNDGRISLDHLRFDHKDQFVEIQGSVSKDTTDVLQARLNRVDLDFVFKALKIKALDFGGFATGTVYLQDIYHTKKLNTRLDVSAFSFNSVVFGDLNLNGTWDNAKQGVILQGDIFKDDTTHVNVDGIILPVKKELSIVFDAKNANAAFLRKYLDNVAKNVSGSLNGKLRLFGDLNNPTVEGTVFVKNGRFGIDFLNTYYTFTDSIRCLPDRILVKDVSFYDKNGWAALGNGYVKHNCFSNFQFENTLTFDNLLVFNANERQNPMFYGVAYGTGMVKIKGTEKQVDIDVSLRNTKNTKITLNFMKPEDISEYQFIHFTEKKKDTTSVVQKYLSLLNNRPIYLNQNSKTDIRLNLMLEANPDATIDMIMDPIAGDKIQGYGNGSMQIQYGTKIPLKIFGNYTIERGKYNFSAFQFFYRNFEIREGSTVSFQGDPYNANLNINATYTVSADLSSLSVDLIKVAGRSSVPVNCILNLTGPLAHPNVHFDLGLKESSNVTLERQIKSYINTEDMMNRQIIYLLTLGSFYTLPEYNTTTVPTRPNDFSNITSAITSTLSSLLGSSGDNYQLGTRIKPKDAINSGTEFEFLLSSQLLDNRLILNINGNVGSGDNINMVTGNKQGPFVGDFDLEYKLTPGGDIRLKAYNRYNYRYYNENKAVNTQGLGIMFRKDFDQFKDLFRKKTPPPYQSSPDTTSKPFNFLKFK